MKLKNPAMLLLLLPLLALLVRAYIDMAKRKLFAPRVLAPWKSLWAGGKLSEINPRILPLIGYAAACAFLILAAARPQTSYQKVKKTVEGIDIQLVLDISASMRIEDFRNMSRFDTAKRILREFILGRLNDRIGLETFSGEAITLTPPTLDYPMVLSFLKAVEIGDLKDGTAIGDGLATAVSRLKESTAKSRILILVTDGDSNVGQVDPLTAGELAKGYGIRVYSVAIGRNGRVAMPFVQRDIFGRQVKTYQWYDNSINPDLLMQISKATNGKFYRVEDDPKVFREVFRDIDQLERRKVETTEQVKYDEKFAKLLVLGLIFFGLTSLAQNTVFRVYP